MNKKTGIRYSVNKRKPIYGWGINDADYVVSYAVNGKRKSCQYYEKWVGMLRRAFSEKYKAKNPSYLCVTVCEEWKYFSNFKKWMETQYFDGLELDKDILKSGNSVYSPETCAFVPPDLNKNLNTKVSLKDRDCPLGVHKVGKMFKASLSGKNGERSYLGSFLNKWEAHKAWQLAKADQIGKLLVWYSTHECFNTEVADALNLRVWRLLLEHCQNKETVRGSI